MHYFRIIFKNIYQPIDNFSRAWTKKQLLENFEKFSKIFKQFLKKIAKNPLFKHFFQKI